MINAAGAAMPTKLQQILAHSAGISMWGGGVIAMGIVAWHGSSSVIEAGHADWRIILLSVIALLVAAPLGIILGMMMIGPVISQIAAWINGAPFHDGDWVYVLVGPHRKQVVQVYEVWAERHQARVYIGDHAKEDFSDVFWWCQICRAKPNDNPVNGGN